MGNHKQSPVAFIFLLMATSSYSQQDELFFRKDYTFINETQSFYKLHTIRKNYDDAISTCQLEGATMFYPEDETEAGAVINFWSNLRPVGSVGIGIASFITEGDFVTFDGKPISEVYNNWAPGEPNNDPPGEQCVALGRDGMLSDVVCSVPRPFICKKTLASLDWNYPCKLPDKEYQFEESLGKCYKFHLKPKTWYDAYATCSAEQSYLAIINSQAEDDVLVRITADAPKDTVDGDYLRGAVHLGFLKAFGRWVTIKGTRLEDSGFSKWGYGQPDNAGGAEVCGSMFYNGHLNDINCSVKLFFICEHDVN